MTEPDAIEAISTLWLADWPAASSSAAGTAVPCAMGNEPAVSADVFAQFSFVWPGGARQRATQGATHKVQTVGIAVVRIWTPAGTFGELLASRLCRAVCTVLDDQQVGGAIGVDGVTMGTGSPESGVTDGRWYSRGVQVPFVFYEQVVVSGA